MEAADSQLGAAGNIVNSYSDRYGWGGGRDRLDRIKQNQYNRGDGEIGRWGGGTTTLNTHVTAG